MVKDGILTAEVINEWTVDPIVERQAILMALKRAEKIGCGDFRVTTAVNGTAEVVDVKVYYA